MYNTQEILNILIASKSVLNKYGVNKLGLFGSSLYGKASENSDIDILIDFESEKETFNNYMEVCAYLEEKFKGKKLDIVSEKGLSPFIGPYILKEVKYV